MEKNMKHDNNPVEAFKRLMLKKDVCTEDTIQTAVVGAATNVFGYAFEAYKNPTMNHFTEETTDGNEVQYVNYESAEAAFDGVLRIYLKEAKNVQNKDRPGFREWSDPYVIFSAGTSKVQSSPIRNTKNPAWNSTLHLVLRKTDLRKDHDGKLHVSLYDHDGDSFFSKFLPLVENKDDLLGSDAIDLEQLKRSGQRSFDLKMGETNWRHRNSTTVHFTVEYISFKDACVSMGIPPDSEKWRAGMESNTSPTGDPEDDLTRKTYESVTLNPIAFINAPSTNTQAWVRANLESKLLTVSFRGTELGHPKDLLIDVSAMPVRLGDMLKDCYAIKPTEELLDDDIRAHAGFVKAYNSVRETILQLAYEITEWSDEWSICLTGHSLGGALATLAAFEFANRRNALGKAPVIGMLSFGAPRVCRPVFAEIYNKTVLYTFRVVDKEDIIHVLPPLFVHTANEVVIFPDGMVHVEGKPLEQFTMQHSSVNAREIEQRDDTGSVDDIWKKFGVQLHKMADKHLKPNYRSIVRNAFAKILPFDL